jgi:hypothetical protein
MGIASGQQEGSGQGRRESRVREANAQDGARLCAQSAVATRALLGTLAETKIAVGTGGDAVD